MPRQPRAAINPLLALMGEHGVMPDGAVCECLTVKGILFLASAIAGDLRRDRDTVAAVVNRGIKSGELQTCPLHPGHYLVPLEGDP